MEFAGYLETEGSATVIKAVAQDADNDALTYSWDIDGNGTVDSVTTTPSVTLTYADQGTFLVGVTVADGKGGSASASAQVQVTNVAPSISSTSPDGSINVGGSYALATTFSDPGINDGPWTVAINWGDGSAVQNVSASGMNASASHAYAAFGVHTISYTVADKDGGVSQPATVTVTVKDPTPPVITYQVSGTTGLAGWYTSNVGVTWSVTDAESGIQAGSEQGCTATSLTSDTQSATYTCTAKNGQGLSTTTSVTVKRDATAPVVSYAGNAGTYTVDQNIAITCSAVDAMSGVASSTCAPVTGAAYEFALGPNSYSATAADRAGNSASASTSFTVQVTSGSVCSLVERFVSNGGVANSLCVKLQHGDYQPFINELAAQNGKKVSTANAALLKRLATALAQR
jgi:hypothetical protein